MNYNSCCKHKVMICNNSNDNSNNNNSRKRNKNDDDSDYEDEYHTNSNSNYDNSTRMKTRLSNRKLIVQRRRLNQGQY